MKNLSKCVVWALFTAMVFSVCDEASAQYRAGRQLRRPRRSSFSDEPVVSPYINMFNPNADPALNYLMFTQPMLRQQDINQQQRAGMAQLRSQLAADEAAVSPFGFRGIGPTGHKATYMDFSHYYGERTSGAAGGGGYQRRRPTTGFGFSAGGGGMMGGMGMMGGGMGMGMF